MDKKQVIDLVKKYTEIIKEKFDLNKVVLYGSYSRGDQKEWSDIDVAIFLNEIKGDIMANEFILYKLRRNIDSRIEPIILDEKNDESGFAGEVLRNGIVLYTSN